jgi:hypothetical protein
MVCCLVYASTNTRRALAMHAPILPFASRQRSASSTHAVRARRRWPTSDQNSRLWLLSRNNILLCLSICSLSSLKLQTSSAAAASSSSLSFRSFSRRVFFSNKPFNFRATPKLPYVSAPHCAHPFSFFPFIYRCIAHFSQK